MVCFVFRDRVPCILGGTPISYVAEDSLKLLLISRLLPPKCWDDRDVPPQLFSVALGTEYKASCISKSPAN